MSNMSNMEKVINLKDMLYCILKQWRKVLNVAVIIALLFGLYKAIGGLSMLLNNEKIEDAKNKYEISLKDYNAMGERLKTEIENLREQSLHQQEYNEKSILMKINPMEKWIGTMQIYIDSKYQIDPALSYQNIDITNRLISAYSNFLRSGELYQEILTQSSDIDEIRYLTEIYSVSADPSTATITINIFGETEANVWQLLEIVTTKFEEHFEVVQKAIGDHSYAFMNESVYSTIDLNLDAYQKVNHLAITDYVNSIGEKNTELEEWGKQGAPTPAFSAGYYAKRTIKSLIKGGLIGMLFMLGWLSFRYISSEAVNTEEDLAAFQLTTLGRITLDQERKKFIPKLDDFIDKLFGRVRSNTMDQSCILTAQKVGAALKNLQISEGILVGSLPKELAEQFTQKMNAAGADVLFHFVGDVLTDPAAAKNLDGQDNVLLFIMRYSTKCGDLAQMLTLLKAWGKNISGCIMVE